VTIQTAYSDQEWGLLVGLPQAVAVAASSVERDGTHGTLVESEAGSRAIAAGRESASELVRTVSAEVVNRIGDPADGETPVLPTLPDPAAGVADVLARATAAVELLGRTVDQGEAETYRHWLVSIADEVAGAAVSGGFLGLGGERISEAERHFIDELRAALKD